MVFVACGLNHQTASVNVREQLALSGPARTEWLAHLLSSSDIAEGLVLSTCNRTEIYCETANADALLPWIIQEARLAPGAIAACFYLHTGEAAVRHLLRVASGLDSMMLGEPQILGQIKQAYEEAEHARGIGETLREVFQYVFGACKRVRAQSGIGKNPVSVASAAVHLATRLLPDPKNASAFLIGSGETASLVAKYLRQQGVKRFFVASRTRDHALKLAEQLEGNALTVNDIPRHLAEADVVISATACPLPFIDRPMVEAAILARQHSPMVLLDLAMPRDICPQVAEVEGAHLYNLDDLQQLTEKGMDERRIAAAHAEELVVRELEHFARWHRARRAKSIICSYREKMQSLADVEVERARRKLARGEASLAVFEEFSQRLVNKLTHTPSVGLRQGASDDHQELLTLVQYLYNPLRDLAPHEEIS